MRKSYKVVLEPIEDGYWLATVPSVQGCLTQGKTISAAKRQIRDALSLFVDNAKTAKLDFETKLPEEFRRQLDIYDQRRRAVEAAQRGFREIGVVVAGVALHGIHLTTREAADLLDVSPQWVAQMATRSKTGKAQRARR